MSCVYHYHRKKKKCYMEFHVRYSGLFFLFSVIDGYKCLGMWIFRKHIQLMPTFLKVLFLVFYYPYCILMIFLMILPIKLLLWCDQPSDLWQQPELIYEFGSDLRDTVDWGRRWLVDFIAGKRTLFHFTFLITLVLLIWKCMGLFLKKNYLDAGVISSSSSWVD